MMSDMDDLLQMMGFVDRKARNINARISKKTYVNILDALCHARAVALLQPGHIVRFMVDGKNHYGVFVRRGDNSSNHLYWFDENDGDLNFAAISPDSILEILSFEELEKRLA